MDEALRLMDCFADLRLMDCFADFSLACSMAHMKTFMAYCAIALF
jgi:hypothetical protein